MTAILPVSLRAKPPVAAPAAPARAPEPGAGPRRAALLLYSLPAADREWLLSELAERERAALQALVAELEALGIPADRDILADVIGPAPHKAGPDAKPPPPPGSPALRALAAADSAALASLLEGEPARLVAELLAAFDSSCRESLLACLCASHRREVEALLAHVTAAPALREALAAALVRRLEALPATSSRSRGMGWLPRLRKGARR